MNISHYFYAIQTSPLLVYRKVNFKSWSNKRTRTRYATTPDDLGYFNTMKNTVYNLQSWCRTTDRDKKLFVTNYYGG